MNNLTYNFTCHCCNKEFAYSPSEYEYAKKIEKTKLLSRNIPRDRIGFPYCIDCLAIINISDEVFKFIESCDYSNDDLTCPNCNIYVSPVAIPAPSKLCFT